MTTNQKGGWRDEGREEKKTGRWFKKEEEKGKRWRTAKGRGWGKGRRGSEGRSKGEKKNKAGGERGEVTGELKVSWEGGETEEEVSSERKKKKQRASVDSDGGIFISALEGTFVNSF